MITPKYKYIYEKIRTNILTSKWPIGSSMKSENDYSLVSATSIMMAAPIEILFMLFQRKFIAGLTGGGLKE